VVSLVDTMPTALALSRRMMDGLLLPILMFGALGLMMVFGMRKQKRQAAEAQ
jgi:preprotein translocase subunit YajC